ncbi:MAG TPA: DUF3891 family protein [Solirubrobacteraceae bacterium]|nr:DUF3891 family protein [Solirubrobacteraceae bacterium]
MLLREDDHGILAIGQPSHAWLSGQLARAWGNDRFAMPTPWEEVCLAAEQHDAGWRTLDLEPTYNPDTQRPHTFLETPLDVHLRLWTEGPRSLVSQSRYAALLVSLHGWRLYERRDLSRMAPEDSAAVRAFLEGQVAFQEELEQTLPIDPDALKRGSLLLWTWDYLSLALCLGWDSATAEGAPAANGQVDIRVQTRGDSLAHLEPWPFAGESLTVRAEGRRLSGGYANEAEMREAFAAAPWETLTLRLEPRA